jgi:excisionase family DNA binding protein
MPLTKKEAADFLGVTIRSIEAYAAKGKLSTAKAKGTRGDITVYDEAELQKLKDERGQVSFIERPSQAEKPSTENLALARTEQSAALAALIDAFKQTKPAPTITDIAHKIILKLDEASALTGLSRATLREAIDSKKLKAKKIGKAWRIKRSDLDTFAAKL